MGFLDEDEDFAPAVGSGQRYNLKSADCLFPRVLRHLLEVFLPETQQAVGVEGESDAF